MASIIRRIDSFMRIGSALRFVGKTPQMPHMGLGLLMRASPSQVGRSATNTYPRVNLGDGESILALPPAGLGFFAMQSLAKPRWGSTTSNLSTDNSILFPKGILLKAAFMYVTRMRKTMSDRTIIGPPRWRRS